MKEIVMRASAKINLSLDIMGVREDGYHLLDMVMQSVGLADTVQVKKAPAEISVVAGKNDTLARGIPQGKRNTAYRAAAAFFEETGLQGGCHIFIEKRIPQEAGMGGGSADAAAVLVGLNELYEAGLSREELKKLGLTIGADVPFCLTGGTALVRGIGEEIEPLPCWEKGHLVIIKPPFGICTATAFQQFDQAGAAVRPDNAALTRAIAQNDLAAMKSAMANVMEETAGHPEIQALKEQFYSLGALAALMTGSGSAVYGIFPSEQTALAAMKNLIEEGQAFLTVPVCEGIQILKKY